MIDPRLLLVDSQVCFRYRVLSAVLAYDLAGLGRHAAVRLVANSPQVDEARVTREQDRVALRFEADRSDPYQLLAAGLRALREGDPDAARGPLERATEHPGVAVMLDFYADWCVECKRMEKTTFEDPAVQQALAGVTLLQADVTANDAEDKALYRAYGLIGPPAILFFDADGDELRNRRLIGYFDSEDFLARLQPVLATAQ